MEEVVVRIAEQATPELAASLTKLMPQLLGSEFVVTIDKLNVLLSQPGIKLFVAMIGDRVVGTAQLSVYERTYSPMAWVDGVVVDEAERGKGIASKLMEAVLQAAKELGLTEVNLTSSPKREAANHLYEKLGFERHDTNYYRYRFTQ